VDDKQILERLKADDATWDGPRLIGLLLVTLAIALAVIYFIASVRSGDYSWHPFAHDNQRELPMSSW
jgi:hypothetical protein